MIDDAGRPTIKGPVGATPKFPAEGRQSFSHWAPMETGAMMLMASLQPMGDYGAFCIRSLTTDRAGIGRLAIFTAIRPQIGRDGRRAANFYAPA
jgi:hypothetical protein